MLLVLNALLLSSFDLPLSNTIGNQTCFDEVAGAIISCFYVVSFCQFLLIF